MDLEQGGNLTVDITKSPRFIKALKSIKNGASCRSPEVDPEPFYSPDKGDNEERAKAICAGCEVRAECLDFAIRYHEQDKIWGGLNDRERRRRRLHLSQLN